jgi:tellurite methyltransferase
LRVIHNKNMKYDQIYQTKNVWGTEPNNLLLKVYAKAEKGGHFLDLGCGQGRDSFFMLKNGFKVTAVDSLREAIKSIKDYILENNLSGQPIEIHCEDIRKFKIEKDKYSMINLYNVLQFLPKEDALTLLVEVKKKLKSKGYIMISGFKVDDFFCKKHLCYFEPQELKNLFSDFFVYFYDEYIMDDKGHVGKPEPHRHSVVKMIAQKI